ETGSVDVVVQVNAGVQNGAVLAAAAQIADSGGRRTRATAETRVQAGVPLQLTMGLNPDPAQPGGLVTGQVTVTNTGAVQLLGVTVLVFLPDEIVSFYPNQTSGASATCTNNSNCLPGQQLIWAVGTLA